MSGCAAVRWSSHPAHRPRPIVATLTHCGSCSSVFVRCILLVGTQPGWLGPLCPTAHSGAGQPGAQTARLLALTEAPCPQHLVPREHRGCSCVGEARGCLSFSGCSRERKASGRPASACCWERLLSTQRQGSGMWILVPPGKCFLHILQRGRWPLPISLNSHTSDCEVSAALRKASSQLCAGPGPSEASAAPCCSRWAFWGAVNGCRGSVSLVPSEASLFPRRLLLHPRQVPVRCLRRAWGRGFLDGFRWSPCGWRVSTGIRSKVGVLAQGPSRGGAQRLPQLVLHHTVLFPPIPGSPLCAG